MSVDCPVCRRPFSTPDMMVDLNSNTVLACGRVVKIMPREAEILSLLIKSYPRPLAREGIAKSIFGEKQLKEMRSALGTVAVHVNRLQRRLIAERLPFKIVSDFGQGFRLDAGIVDEAPMIVERIPEGMAAHA